MNWRHFFVIFLRNVIVVTAAATIGLGLFGFVLAGREGLVNGASWGFILGLLSIPYSAVMIFYRFWSDVAGDYGRAWVDKEMNGDDWRPGKAAPAAQADRPDKRSD